MDKSAVEQFVKRLMAYGLQGRPYLPIDDVVGAWLTPLREFSASEIRASLERHLDSEYGGDWPTPGQIRDGARAIRNASAEAARPSGCLACDWTGGRVAIQRIRLAEGGVSVRERRVACDCDLGRQIAAGGLETWRTSRERCPDIDGRKLYITGTRWRLNPDDAVPPTADANGTTIHASPWYAIPSPEEVYGPARGAELRAVGLGQVPSGRGAAGYLAVATASASVTETPGIRRARLSLMRPGEEDLHEQR